MMDNNQQISINYPQYFNHHYQQNQQNNFHHSHHHYHKWKSITVSIESLSIVTINPQYSINNHGWEKYQWTISSLGIMNYQWTINNHFHHFWLFQSISQPFPQSDQASKDSKFVAFCRSFGAPPSRPSAVSGAGPATCPETRQVPWEENQKSWKNALEK